MSTPHPRPTAPPPPISIAEHDESGALLATYVTSSTSTSEQAAGERVDVIPPVRAKTPWRRGLDVFLPRGYPGSVSEDYMAYQIYDSLQAFASSIAGLISSRAVLEGVGVGDPTASPTSALLLSILQESAGRLATIAFAHRAGAALEPECKMYRLLADVLNDAAMVLDLLSPVLPRGVRVGVLSAASVLRALCGVAAGSAKASLSAHFARGGNLGEVNAKDSSQETVISLVGMLAGSVVVSRLHSAYATWSALVLLLAVHLGMNYAAVRAVNMRSLNRQRANIVMSTLIERDVCQTPEQVSQREKIFESDGVLRWEQGRVLGYCRLGVTLRDLLRAIPSKGKGQRSFQQLDMGISDLMALFKSESYMLWYDERSSMCLVVLKKGAKPVAQLKAWTQALMIARRRQDQKDKTSPFSVSELKSTLLEASRLLEKHLPTLADKGWDLSIGALETQSSTRISLEEEDHESLAKS